jgi:WD40 repeat protein
LDLQDFSKFERREWKSDEHAISRSRNGRQLEFWETSFAVVNAYDGKTLWEEAYPAHADASSLDRVCLSPDGQRLLILHPLRHTIELRDAADGKRLGTLRVPEVAHLQASLLKFSRHSRYLFLNRVVWDLKTCELLSHSVGPQWPSAMWFSSDGAFLCVRDGLVSQDGHFWVFDVQAQRFRSPPRRGNVFACAGRPAEIFAFTRIEPLFTAEGEWVGDEAAHKLAGRIERIDAATGKLRWSWRTPPEFAHQHSPYGQESHRIVSAVMTKDQQRVLFANSQSFGILDLATGKARSTARDPFGDFRQGPECTVGKGNQALYCDHERRLAIIDHGTGREVWRTQIEYPEVAKQWRHRAFSIGDPICADGKIYVSSEFRLRLYEQEQEEVTTQIEVLDSTTGRAINRLPCPKVKAGELHLALSPGGDFLAIANSHALQLMNTSNGDILGEAAVDRAFLSSVAISGDGKLVAATSSRGEIFVWAIEKR